MATRRRGAPRMNLNVPANWSSDRQAAVHFLAAARAEFGDTAATMETAEAVARAHGINVSDRGGTRAYTDRVIAALRPNASRLSSQARTALLHVGVPVTQVDQLSARSNGQRKPATKPAKPRKPKLQLYDPSQPLPHEVAPELPRPRKSRPNNATSAAPGDRLTFYTQLVEDIIGKLVSMTPMAQHEAARALIHHLLLLEGVRDHNEAYRVSQLVREELIAEGHLSRSNGARVTAVEVQAQIRRAILLQVRAGERARVDALLQALTDLCADKPPEVVVRRLIAADVWS